jgi:hypothetical protein
MDVMATAKVAFTSEDRGPDPTSSGCQPPLMSLAAQAATIRAS